MRRFPRPITPDNDTATKNARSIPGPGHKPGSRSGADSDSERAGPGAGMKEPAGPGWRAGGVYARGPGWRSGAQPRRAGAGGAAASVVFSQQKPEDRSPVA